MSKPLVSIVVPAYNHARHLPEAIDSVLAQDYEPIELIVLNDGSKDDTAEVLARYGARFHHENQQNMGQAATLNKGWAMARGKYLAYLSADDVLLPGAVAASVTRLEQAPELAMVYCDFNLVDVDSRKIRTVNAPDYDYEQMVVEGICAPGPGAFFRRDAHLAAGGWDTRYRQVPDYEYWLRLGLQGGAERIPKVLAAFRVHENSQTFSQTSIPAAEEFLRVIERYFERPDVPPAVRSRHRFALARAHLTVTQLHLRAGRYALGAGELRRACMQSPSILLRSRSWRMLFNGLFNRLGYRVLRVLRGRAS